MVYRAMPRRYTATCQPNSIMQLKRARSQFVTNLADRTVLRSSTSHAPKHIVTCRRKLCQTQLLFASTTLRVSGLATDIRDSWRFEHAPAKMAASSARTKPGGPGECQESMSPVCVASGRYIAKHSDEKLFTCCSRTHCASLASIVAKMRSLAIQCCDFTLEMRTATVNVSSHDAISLGTDSCFAGSVQSIVHGQRGLQTEWTHLKLLPETIF